MQNVVFSQNAKVETLEVQKLCKCVSTKYWQDSLLINSKL